MTMTIEMPTGEEIAKLRAEAIAERQLAAIRAEIALVSGVVPALANGPANDDVRNEWGDQALRLVRLLAQERELMEGDK
jgi:hypothetical protein